MFTTESRKRKQQDDCKVLSSSMPNTSSWSDFIYSSPSSPCNENENNQFNFDSFFEQHQLHIDPNNQSGTNSRRHSVAVGEMDYHSFDFSKQELNVLTSNDNAPWDELQLLLNSTNNQQHNDRPIHKRTMSLREDDPTFATLLSPTNTTTTSSNFFSTSFLEALVAENNSAGGGGVGIGCRDFQSEDSSNGDSATIMSDLSFMDSASDLLSQPGDFLKLANTIDVFNNNTNTITPSAITNEINNMADWLLEQQQVKQMHSQSQKRQRRSINSLSPVSPTHTIGSSSLSSLSPSPPITPMQPASLGFEPIPFQQPQPCSNQKEDWDIDHQLSNINNKSGIISARILQGQNTASSLKPLIQDYLIRRDIQDRSLPVTGERTVMVLTSRVAQKSYGTEKRFLCPPPTTVLKGANWWTNTTTTTCSDKPNLQTEPKKPSQFFQSPPNVLSSPKLTIHISGETINQTGVLEWQTPSGTIIDNSIAAANNASNSSITGRCVSKQLYINDADEKRKRVEVLAKIQLGNGLQLGTFPSKGIKVISKPSKKRQSIKNMELCIHHGTTISLFNRIRSQTVSTKYLGVSNGQAPSSPNTKANTNASSNGTCFVARTGSWDPFVIWIVDTTRSPDTTSMPRPSQHHPNNPNFPPPPAIALQTPSSTQQPIAIHYNQPIVLQCVSTGLVSPVMVIRKVDKGSMVLGGNRMEDLSGKTGGECGDETLGDPVSQLHKIAFQIVQDPTFSHHNKARYQQQQQQQQQQKSANNNNPDYKIPQSCHPVTYLACLNDVVGMHKTTYSRHLVSSCQPIKLEAPNNNWNGIIDEKMTEKTGCEQLDMTAAAVAATVASTASTATAVTSTITTTTPAPATTKARRRMSSISSTETKGRRGSLADRRGSSISDSSGLEGACWTEDVSDAAVWTIVGTDCASYTFWTPSDAPDQSCFNMPFNQQATTTLSNTSAPITPFPLIYETSTKKIDAMHLTLSGENLTRDLNIWFGDIKSAQTEYKSRDTITCSIPDAQELLSSPTLVLEDDGLKKKIPLLLVRGDGVVYRTDQFYSF
ncbi:hypothetical protein HPULCUR_006953 [Helicostylum pulchrum]|uniref:LAG1-DNAbind-domain-containing protein n=1 Tax=Helicostylum pulchrum TaxID=562976 RepID=A0ABP9Y473_9FUNG